MSQGLSLDISVSSLAGERINRFIASLEDRGPLNAAVAVEALELTRNHLVKIAQTRHTTARKLGANPTGHWAQAAEKTTAKSDQAGATVTVHQVGIGRAAHDVDIKPGPGKQFLTIPARAEAYGFVYASLKPRIAAARAAGDKRPWFVFVRSVHQPQDRGLLPSDAAYRTAALRGIRNFVKHELLERRAV